MTVWVAVAKIMMDLKYEWWGTLMFVAQPAEEGDGGAKAMVADGLFKRFQSRTSALPSSRSGPYGYVFYKREPSTRPPTD